MTRLGYNALAMRLRTATFGTGIALAAWVMCGEPTRAQSARRVTNTSANALVAPPYAAPPDFPDWAYPWDPTFKASPPDAVPRHVPDSPRTFSFVDARDAFLSPDWHPADHPRMPEVVQYGRKPRLRACGMCHRAEGTGGPENSSLAGQPAPYLVQQMIDFKRGARRFSGPRRGPVVLMIQVARNALEPEIRVAAEYFAALKPKRTLKVVEGETIPSAFVHGNFYTFKNDGSSEPLGRRIVEAPFDREQFELRDSRSLFRVYVPPGSIARGEALVRNPRPGTTITCARCHGPELRGGGVVPGIAGRSPSYMMRQLYDIKHGARRGPGAWQMRATVESLSNDDMLDAVAYLATLAP